MTMKELSSEEINTNIGHLENAEPPTETSPLGHETRVREQPKKHSAPMSFSDDDSPRRTEARDEQL